MDEKLNNFAEGTKREQVIDELIDHDDVREIVLKQFNYMRINGIGNEINLSMNISEDPKYWDEKKFRFKTTHPQAHHLNSIIQQKQKDFWGYVGKMGLVNKQITNPSVKTFLRGNENDVEAKRLLDAFQFFIETLIIGQLGGLVGIIFGILIGYGISTAIDFSFVIPWSAIIAAVITTFIVAVVSGSYPALKASKLDPIEALRYE